MIKKFLSLLVCPFLWACAGQCGSPDPVAPASGPAYIVLPGNYLVEVMEGKKLDINPQAGEFALFRTPKEAWATLKNEVAANRLKAGAWEVFRLEEDFSEVARPCGKNRYCLAKDAVAVDWKPEN